MANKELLFSVTKDDFRVEYFRAPGPGGQNKNKTMSAVRITHIESGAVGQATEERSQLQNKKIAFTRLVNGPRFKAWHKRKVSEIMMKKTIEEQVDEMMIDENIQIEGVDKDGKWVIIEENDISPKIVTKVRK